MLSPTGDSIRLFLHILAASVWVGGQITVAGIVPAVRRAHPQATKVIAQAFGRVAWPAFVVAVITGMWSLLADDVSLHTSAWQATLLLKIGVAIVSGMFAAVHSIGKTKVALAVGGAVGALAAVAAMYLGILLAHAN